MIIARALLACTAKASDNSSKKLASYIRRQWSSGSAKQVESSLVHDIVHPDTVNRDGGSIRRLRKFFPGAIDSAGAHRIRRLLGERTSYPSYPHPVSFATYALIRTTTPRCMIGCSGHSQC
jgi:hypothetical protein